MFLICPFQILVFKVFFNGVVFLVVFFWGGNLNMKTTNNAFINFGIIYTSVRWVELLGETLMYQLWD